MGLTNQRERFLLQNTKQGHSILNSLLSSAFETSTAKFSRTGLRITIA